MAVGFQSLYFENPYVYIKNLHNWDHLKQLGQHQKSISSNKIKLVCIV